jgi:outer membrane biosynthesis protein TonB
VVRRVIERMRFRPAKVNNQAVKVRVQLPITFQPG